MTDPQSNPHVNQATCAKCGRLWQFGDVAVEVDGPWRHHDCADPQLELTVPGPQGRPAQ